MARSKRRTAIASTAITAHTALFCTPAMATARALECCAVEWLNHNPVRSAPGRCVWCGRPENAGATVVPFGVGEHHAWLHPDCWPAWHAHRRAAASLAITEMLGIGTRQKAKGSNNEDR